MDSWAPNLCCMSSFFSWAVTSLLLHITMWSSLGRKAGQNWIIHKSFYTQVAFPSIAWQPVRYQDGTYWWWPNITFWKISWSHGVPGISREDWHHFLLFPGSDSSNQVNGHLDFFSSTIAKSDFGKPTGLDNPADRAKTPYHHPHQPHMVIFHEATLYWVRSLVYQGFIFFYSECQTSCLLTLMPF